MIFWIVAALMTAGAVALLIRPLARRGGAAAPRSAYDLAVYRDQLAEIERDAARGLITADQAGAARAEIGRRMLSAADAAPDAGRAGGRGGRAAAVALAVLVPAAALAIYLPTGNPDLPAQPFAARDMDERVDRQAQVAAAEALARRLETAPGDIAGWLELGERLTALGRPDDAVDAYARAVGLAEGDPLVTGIYAEALVGAAGGMVTRDARLAFEQVLEASPGEPRARYYLALERLQAGDLQAALDAWIAMLADAPADAPWLPVVRERIAETAGRLGIDVADLDLPAPRAPAGPDAGDMAAAAAMTPEQRAEMIRGMVDGLAARLEESPDDVEGWMRLGQAYRVLGEPDRAVDALARAAELAPDDPAVLTAYADTLLASADGETLPPAFMPTIERLYAIDPDNVRALWFMGGKALAENRPDEAAALWRRALAQLTPGSEEHRIVAERIEALERSAPDAGPGTE